MSLEFRLLRHFVTLCELRSFARAAPALGLSQPALSRSIQSLERQIGSQLVVRAPSGVTPTDVGRVLAQRAREILQLSEDLDRDLMLKSTLQSGHVAVGAGPFPAETVFVAALSRFISEHPLIQVRLQVRGWDELLSRLRAREIDFFVAETSTMQREVDIEIQPLNEHPVYIVSRADHPLVHAVECSLEDVLAYPMAAMAKVPPRVLQPTLSVLRRSSEAQRRFPAIEDMTLSAIKRMMLGSDVVSALPLPCVRDELRSGTLVALLTKPWLRLSYGVITLKAHPMSPAAQRLREFITTEEVALTELERQMIAEWTVGSTRKRRRAAARSASTP